MSIQVKRVYDDGPETRRGDGTRYLVDRLWPRGIRKDGLELEAWLKELGPSNELRRFFSHDASKWSDFKKRYFQELMEKEELWRPILSEARRGTVTLLYSARDEAHNQAIALREFLGNRTGAGTRKK